MIDINIIRVAVQTTLLNEFQKESQEKVVDMANEIADNIKSKIIDYQLITNSLDSDSLCAAEDVLSKEELKCFVEFAIAKKVSPQKLLRQCIMFYCPLEMMVQQLHEDQNKGEKIGEWPYVF